MSEVVRSLRNALRDDPSILDDARRCRNLLNDLAPGNVKETNLIVAALEDGVPQALRASSGGGSLTPGVSARLRRSLEHTRGMSPEAATWAVDSWASVLGLEDATPTVPAPTQPAPGPRPQPAPAPLAELTPEARRRRPGSGVVAGIVAIVVLVGVGAAWAAGAFSGGGSSAGQPSTSTSRVTTSTAPTTTTVFVPGVVGAPLPRTPSPGLITFSAFSNNKAETGVWVVRPDGTGAHRVDPAISNCQQGGMGALRWDGKAILFSPGINCGLMAADIDGSAPRTIDRGGSCLFGCDWAPDGRSIVYETGGGTSPHLVVAGLDGSGKFEIGIGSGAEWSPDGRAITFKDASDNIVVYDLSTRQSRVVASAHGGLFGPTFDPASKRIAVSGNLSGLKVIDLTTGAVQPVCAKAGTLAEDPSWSPDGASIAYDDNTGIHICDVATGQVRALPVVGYSDQNPSWR